ncbi:hypothetical protein HYT74_01085 [Candidatus Daviesbacteria bacterium]|nr:hypothetical protein [Candidatus Daviesbacteria bacterium]MBI2334536.1 hypothetical protein [Candidatus Daviesbacteria bacterium]
MNKWILLLLTVLLVVLSQYYLLSGVLTLGFKPDDWILYFSYKLLGSHPLSKIISVWLERGIYTTYQVYYLGFLDSLVSLNYQAFQYINLTFKILATLSLYPLTQVLFKRKILSFLAVLLFSIAPSAVGPLEFVVKGSDYLAIIWMNLFLMVYYLIIANKLVGLKYYFLLFFLFILSLAFSPIRIFPLIVIPPLVEIFLILKHFDWAAVKKSLIRLVVLYGPFVVLILYSPISVLGDARGPFGVFDVVLKGNWFHILAPLSGIGYTFISNDFWGKIFGLIMTDNFKNYLYFLAGGPTIILGLLTALIVWAGILKHKLLFFIVTALLNFIFQVLIFFIAFHHLQVQTFPQANYDPINLYSVIFGGYIIILGFMVLLNWLKWGRSDKVLAGIWMGSAVLLIFTSLTWVFGPLGTGFSSTSYYLVVASIGSSLMVAAFLVSIYDKLKVSRLKLLAFIPFLILIPILGMNSYTIHSRFSSLNKDGLNAAGQIAMQQEARRVMKDYKISDSALWYFDTSDITNGPFYSEGFLTSFPFFMHLRDNKLTDGCIGVIYEDAKMVELRKLVQVQDGIPGFNHPALCVNNGKGGFKSIFFNAEDFYAFKLKGKKLIDIKEIVLDKLNINQANE